MNRTDYEIDDLLAIKKPYVKTKQTKTVYFLFYKGVLVYVGKATNEQNRFSQHEAEKLFDETASIECTAEEYSAVESHYIAKFRPFYNGSENKYPIIEQNTYQRINDLIFFNGGTISNRYILDVSGNEIINRFNNRKIGYIINKKGFIHKSKNKFFKCMSGRITELEIKTMFSADPHVDYKITASKSTYFELETVYDYYFYSKVRNYKTGWFHGMCKEKSFTFDQDVLYLIDLICAKKGVQFEEVSKNKNKKSDYSRPEKWGERAGYKTPNEIRDYWRKQRGYEPIDKRA